jgi:hypothetical protein
MPPQSSTTKIWWDTTVDAYRVVTPYRPQFVELLKQLLPASDRAWDAASKTWTITEKFLPSVKDLTERIFGGTATIVSRQQAQAAQQPPPQRGGAATPVGKLIEEWFQLLPYSAAQKAYRYGAMELHPDRGGSMETMSKFNSLWQQIEKIHFLKEK